MLCQKADFKIIHGGLLLLKQPLVIMCSSELLVTEAELEEMEM